MKFGNLWGKGFFSDLKPFCQDLKPFANVRFHEVWSQQEHRSVTKKDCEPIVLHYCYAVSYICILYIEKIFKHTLSDKIYYPFITISQWREHKGMNFKLFNQLLMILFFCLSCMKKDGNICNYFQYSMFQTKETISFFILRVMVHP